LKNKKGIQDHHTSYNPERKKVVTKEWHVKYHGHGTGPVKGYRKRRWGFNSGFFVGIVLTFAVIYRDRLYEFWTILQNMI